MKHMLFLGYGFTAAILATRLDPREWQITATSRSDEGTANIIAQGHRGVRFDQLHDVAADITHIVSSIPPDEAGDPVLRQLGASLASRGPSVTWTAYLSTTGVYGDHQGGWVDEETALTPNTSRGERRLWAEEGWLQLWHGHGLPVHIFRLAGIYGPGRNQLDALRAGTARRIVKPGQVFSRIHVSDIVGILLASMTRPAPGRAYNVADNEPCPPQDVVAFAAELLGLPPPPEERFEDVALSPMARSFFADSKRVSNRRVKQELNYQFLFPSYREGLRDLFMHHHHQPAAPGVRPSRG